MRCQARKSDGNTCGRPFAPGQEVIIVLDDNDREVKCCCEECAKRTEESLKQGDMFGNREVKRFFVLGVDIPHSTIEGISIAEGKDDLKVIMKIRLPETVEVDEIKQFMGGGIKAKVTIAMERLDPIPQEKPETEIEEPDPMTVEGSLFRALHHMEGAVDRWQERREAGMTDAELKAAIAEEFGVEGALAEADMKPCAFDAGGGDPKFWFDDNPVSAKPTLAKKKLVTKVREIMNIPAPTGKKKDKAA